MNNGHLADELIQEYAWDPQNVGSPEQLHMSSCDQCKSIAANYRLLFLQVEELDAPAFDFDLAQSVLNQLPAIETARAGDARLPGLSTGIRNPGFSAQRRVSWALVVGSLLAVGVTGTTFYFLKDYFENMIAGVSVMVTYLIIMTIILILAFLVVDEYRKYNKQINSLDI